MVLSTAQRTTGSTHFQETGYPLLRRNLYGGYGGRTYRSAALNSFPDSHTSHTVPYAEVRSLVAFGGIQAIVNHTS